MDKSISYSDARANLAKVWDNIIDDRQIVRLTRRGKEDIAVLPASELSSLLESIHLLRSPKNAERLHAALKRAYEYDDTPIPLNQFREEIMEYSKKNK